MKPDRKLRIDYTILQADKINGHMEADLAWQRLCNELRKLSDADAMPPRFNSLLRAIWVAATNEQS